MIDKTKIGANMMAARERKMAVRPIDGEALLGIERLLDTDVVRKSETASWLLDQVLHDIQAMPTLPQPNEPLTLEQLREMDGEPVYLIVDDGYEPLEMWALIDVPEEDHIVLINNIGGRSAYYSDDGLKQDHITVYRRPPKGEEDKHG